MMKLSRKALIYSIKCVLMPLHTFNSLIHLKKAQEPLQHFQIHR